MHSSIVQKLLTVLTVISAAPKPMSFSEIVTASGLNKSTIHRLLAICTSENLVRYDAEARTYFLGSKVFDLVRSADYGHDITEIALDEMVKLFDKYAVNVTLGVPSGHEVAYLRILEAPHLFGRAQRPGMRDPVHCSASGKALFAHLPDMVIKSKLKGYDFKRHTSRTITNLEDFGAELNFVREHGYAKNDREEFDHFCGISAPVFNYLGEPIAVLNMWSVLPHHTIDDLVGWSDDLKASSEHVTSLIGGKAPEISAPVAW